jgi:hypothetical protein
MVQAILWENGKNVSAHFVIQKFMTPLKRDVPEKLVFAQLVQKFTALYRIKRLTVMTTRACH